MRHTTGIAASGAVLAVLGLAAWTARAEPPADSALPKSGLVLGHGMDRYPSGSANEWVTYADYVAVVTPMSETEIAADATEVERGEGMIGRQVTMRVDKILWSSPQAAAPAPQTFNRDSSGWVFKDADRAKFALHERPRVELGHTYVAALHWEPERCSEGDPTEPAHWVGLGAGSALPFDSGVINKGEYEGSVQEAPAPTVPADTQGIEIIDLPVTEVMSGKGETELVNLLEQAVPQTPLQRVMRPQVTTVC
ncbi:hypothetical protein [Streptomyces sp. NPDC013457]|uniref:hypothetical protein n=1 Tax=Streptomyces sp. NPDC013457 TaxID=3364866 RepID=UPI0036FA2A6C